LPAEGPPGAFEAPSPAERLFNRVFGSLVGLGLGLRHNYLLQVQGRTTGRILTPGVTPSSSWNPELARGSHPEPNDPALLARPEAGR
jgi:hypothetical protein